MNKLDILSKVANVELREIINSHKRDVEIVSIESYTPPTYNTPQNTDFNNTKLTLKVDIGFGLTDPKKCLVRTYFYARDILEDKLPEFFVSTGIVDADVELLNNQGLEIFTTDVMIRNGQLVARSDSLNYLSYSEEEEPTSSIDRVTPLKEELDASTHILVSSHGKTRRVSLQQIGDALGSVDSVRFMDPDW